jgi:hypothetical protein
MQIIFSLKQLDDESWRDCARRIGQKYGLEFEVMKSFEANLRAGDSEEVAAIEACHQWDLCDYEYA